jgi:hypothetical protein
MLGITTRGLREILGNVKLTSIDWVIHDHSNEGRDSYGTIETNGDVIVEENNIGFTIVNPKIIRGFINIYWEIDEDLGGEYGCLLKSLNIKINNHDLSCFLMIPFNSEEERDTFKKYI